MHEYTIVHAGNCLCQTSMSLTLQAGEAGADVHALALQSLNPHLIKDVSIAEIFASAEGANRVV